MAASSKICLITGGNSGIGLEVAKILARKGHEVILACRSTARGDAAADAVRAAAHAVKAATPSSGSDRKVHVVPCDLADLDSVRSCSQEVLKQWPRLDVLVCNAAVITSKHKSTKDGLDEMLQVNHLGHFLLTHLLLPLLAKSPGARICCVSSEVHRRITPEQASPSLLSPYDPAATPWVPMTIYAHTKLFNIWFTRQLAKQLPAHVSVNAASPGFVPVTGLGRNLGGVLGGLAMRYLMPWAPFAVSLAEGGRRIADVCLPPEGAAGAGGSSSGSGSSSNTKGSGQYYSKGLVAEPSAAALDNGKAEQLWQLSMQLAGIADGKYLS